MKKLIALCLILMLTLGVLPLTGLAVDAVEPGKDSNGAYMISSAAELLWFQRQVSQGNASINAVLTADIDLSSVCSQTLGNWTSIPAYSGTFDGQGHTIKNLFITNANAAGQGLFAEISTDGVVKNIGILNANVEMTTSKKVNNAKAAALAGSNKGRILNCFVLNSNILTNANVNGQGGIVCGNNTGKIENAFVRGCTIKENQNKKQIGGIAGYNTGTIKSCYTAGITLTTSASDAYPISGTPSTGTYSNCYILSTDKEDPKATSENESWFKSASAIAALGVKAYQQDANNENDGYPILTFVTSADKTQLEHALSETASITGYYTQDDRWNGKTYSETGEGFWAEMHLVISAAQTVYQNEDATQDEVDAATATLNQQNLESELSKAIAKLIPDTQINPTELYEAIQLNNIYYPPANEEQYTTASWAAYRAVMDSAESYLRDHYNDPVENKPTVDAHTAAVKALAANHVLDKKLSTLGNTADARMSDAQMAYTGLKYLYNTLFAASGLTETDYTDDSWGAYSSARQNAKTFLESHNAALLTLESGVNEALSYTEAYQAFWSACYGLQEERDSITVMLDVTDTHARVNGTEHLAGGMYTLSLSGGATLEDAVTAAGLDLEELGERLENPTLMLGVYINGVYTQYTMVQESFPGAMTSGIKLKDGDHILLARMDAPMAQSSSGSGADPAGLREVGNYIRYAQFLKDNKEFTSCEATSGAALDLEVGTVIVDSFNALPTHYNGRIFSLAGAEIYRSEACATEAEARRAAASIPTGVRTADDGSISLVLYSAEGKTEGWYLLNVLSADTNPGLTNAPHLLVHVTDPDDLSEVRAQLIEQLDAIYNAYGEDFYTTDQLETIRNYYETACTSLEDKTLTSGELNAAYETAYEGITAIQLANENSMNLCLATVRAFLKYLPNMEDAQAGKLYSIDKMVLDQLFGTDGWYTRMTAYQRSQFTISEEDFLAFLQEKYENSNQGAALPQIPAFTLTIEVRDIDTEQLVEIPIFDYLRLYYIDAISYNERLDLIAETQRNGAATYDEATATYTLPTDGYYWMSVSSGALASAMGDYTNVGFAFSFDDHYVYSPDGVTNLMNTYTLRENATKTVFVRLEDSNALQNAKNTALETLRTDYQSYDSNDYSMENWSALNQAYQDGVSNINAAGTTDAVQTALSLAQKAMARVKKSTSNTGAAIPNWGAGDIFDAGKQVGTVSLSVENSTFPEGAFYKGGDPLFEKPAYPIGEYDTMMTVILRALYEAGFDWDDGSKSGFDIDYVANISKGGQKMGEFSGERGSGWMGSLNDFLVDEGLSGFSVVNGQLADGDEIRFMYTQNLGEDLGGTWNNSDTTLFNLSVTDSDNNAVSFVPGFEPGDAGGSYDYALILSGDSTELKLVPTAANKNFLVKTFLNEKVTDNTEGNSFYKRTETIPVSVGDIVYVGVGERAWPSMNKTGAEARLYTGTWYALHIINADNGADYVNELIAALPAAKSISSSNCETVMRQINNIDAVIEALSDSEQARVDTSKLKAVREVVTGYETILSLQAEIAALPKIIEDTKEIKATVETYNSLSDSQKSMLTLAEKNKIENTSELLDIMDDVDDVKKDFTTAEVNKDGSALKEFLEVRLSGLADSVSASIDSVTAAVKGKTGNDGSYSATITFKKGNGTAKKVITGAITRSSDASVSEIAVNDNTYASTKGEYWEARLPYGSDMTTATFNIKTATFAEASAPEMGEKDGSVWTFTVTAENGKTADYKVKLSLSEVKVTVLDSNVYDISDDTVVTSLSPVGVSGLDAIIADDLEGLPVGTKEVTVWLTLKIKAHSDDETTLTISAWYAADGKDASKLSDEKLKDVKLTVTVPLAGTDYAKVRFGDQYLDSKGSASGIEFAVAAAGDYTLIPDASLVKVTFHLNGGTSTAVTDGQQIVYFPEDANKDLPRATREGDYSFEGWFADKDGTGKAYTVVSKDLPTDLYAVWKSLEEDVEVIEYIDKNKVSVDSVLEDDGTAVVTVKSAEPCVVILKDGDSYVPLKAVKDGDSYVFSRKDYEDSMVFIVAAKGDFDKDGDLDADDFTAANKAILNSEKIDTLQLLVMGANGKKLKTVDLAKLYLALASGKVEW